MRLSTFCRISLAGTGLAIVLVAAVNSPAQSRALSITAVGQVLIQSDFRVHTPSLIADMAPLLKGSDVVIGNLEGTIVGEADEKTLPPRHGNHAPPAGLDALMALGFNMLPLANNHTDDAGIPGIHSTIAEAKRRKLTVAGSGATLKEAAAPAYMRTAKGTVALVAFASGYLRPDAPATETRPGLNELRVEKIVTGGVPHDIKPNENDAQRILQSIRDAARNADLVITHQHNHVNDPATLSFATDEFEHLSGKRMVPPDWIKRWTHAQVDAGADVVLLTGSPVFHGVEIYRNKLILYDLGNFMFNCVGCGLGAESPAGTHGFWTENDAFIYESVVAKIEFQGKKVQSVTFRPIVLNPIGRGGMRPPADAARVEGDPHHSLWGVTRGLPEPATGEKGRVILNRLAGLSWSFGTWVEVNGNAAEIRLK